MSEIGCIGFWRNSWLGGECEASGIIFFRIDRLGLLRNPHETSLSPGQTSFHGVSIVVTIFAPELTLARIFVVTRDQATGHTLSIGFAKQPLVFEIALAGGSDLLSVLLPPELVDLCMQGEEYGRTE